MDDKRLSNLIQRLKRYSQNVVAYKLDADFAAAVNEATETLDQVGIEIENYRRNLGDCRSELQTAEMNLDALNDMYRGTEKNLFDSEAARTDLAKRLTEQLKKIEQLTKELEMARGERDVVHEAQVALMKEMTRVKKELDMAVDCITKMAHSGRIWMCSYCQHAKFIGTTAADCEVAGACRKPYTAFVWRGVEEEHT